MPEARPSFYPPYGGVPLASPVQSVPEAELVALTEAVRASGTRVVLVFDCYGLQEGLMRGRGWCLSPRNAFACRWRTLWELLHDRSWSVWAPGPLPECEIMFKWMPAHRAKRAIEEGDLSVTEWHGNKEADRLAKLGALEHRLPEEFLEGVKAVELVDLSGKQLKADLASGCIWLECALALPTQHRPIVRSHRQTPRRIARPQLVVDPAGRGRAGAALGRHRLDRLVRDGRALLPDAGRRVDSHR